MSDLIKREDAIRAVAEVLSLNRFASFKNIKDFGRFAERMLRNVPSADRPSAEWIFHYRDKWMVKAECPKCHRRFEFSPRAIWKCCPMCETRMKGADDGTDND